MKLRILRNLGRGLPPYTEGQEVDCKKDEADLLLKMGLAESPRAADEEPAPPVLHAPAHAGSGDHAGAGVSDPHLPPSAVTTARGAPPQGEGEEKPRRKGK